MKKRRAVLRAVLLPLMVLAIAMCAYLIFRVYIGKETKRRAFATLNHFALQQMETIALSVSEQYGVLESTAAYVAAHWDDPAARENGVAFARALADYTVLLNIGFADAEGNAELTNGATTNIADRAYFQASMRGERAYEKVLIGKVDGVVRFLFSVPIQHDGATAGVVFGSMDETSFSSLVDVCAYAEGAYAFICRDDGDMLVAGKATEAGARLSNLFNLFSNKELEPGYTKQIILRSMRAGNTVNVAVKLKSGEAYVSGVPMGINDWYVVNVVSRAAIDTANEFINLYALAMLIGLVLVCGTLIAVNAAREARVMRTLIDERDIIKRNEESYALISELSNDVLFRYDLSTGEVHFNGAFLTALGYVPPWRCVDQLRETKSYVYAEDVEIYHSIFRQIQEGAPRGSVELRLINARGIPTWQRIDFIVQRDAGGGLLQVVGRLTNIDRDRRTLQELQQRAECDALTGLVNRTALAKRTEKCIEEASADTMHAFMMIDVDGFKRFNDTQGHPDGDRLLTLFAELLRSLFRSGDTVCRMGGDEFSVLMRDVSSVVFVRMKAEAICVRARGLSGSFARPVTVSVGVALFPQDGASFEELYANADMALYGAKAAGKDRYLLFSDNN